MTIAMHASGEQMKVTFIDVVDVEKVLAHLRKVLYDNR